MERSKSQKKPIGRKSVIVGIYRKSLFNQPIADLEPQQHRRSRSGSAENDYRSVKSNSKSVTDFDAVSTGSNLTAKRRLKARKSTIVKQSFAKISEQYIQNAQAFEGITYTDDGQGMSWQEMAKTFIFDRRNKRVNQFLRTIAATKMESELELKKKIERRIYAAKEYRLANIFGKDLTRRLKTYVGAVLESYQAKEEQDVENDQKRKTVSFGVSFGRVPIERSSKQLQQQLSQADDPDFYFRMKTLQRNHTEAATKLPLLSFHHIEERSEQKQLIHFFLSYYDSLASENEKKQLQQLFNNDAGNELYQRNFLKDKQRQKKMRLVFLASPKRTASKKLQNLGMTRGGSTKNQEQNATNWVIMQKSRIQMLQTSLSDLKQTNKNQKDDWARIKNRLSQTRSTLNIADRVKLKFSKCSSPRIHLTARTPAVPAINSNSIFERMELASDESPRDKRQETAPIKISRLMNKAPSMPQLKRQRSVDLIKKPENDTYRKKLVKYMEKRQDKIAITTPLEQEILKIDQLHTIKKTDNTEQILEGSNIGVEQLGAVHSARFNLSESQNQLQYSKTIPVKKIGQLKVPREILMYLQKQPILKQPYRK